jgi:YVTN family beta-propeller protein
MRRFAPLAALLVLAAGCGGSKVADPATTAPQPHAPKVGGVKLVARPIRLAPTATGQLGSPVQDAAAAPSGRGAVLAGGLTAADTSRSVIAAVTASGDRQLGSLPVALHDAAAAAVGGAVYVFGGGDGVRQLDGIVRVDLRSGATQTVGRLPAPSSDQAGTALGGTAYVVGGYTGTRWLDTIVAYRPATGARVVAHLPAAVRYAAVAGAAGRLVIAGGSLENGTASSAVYVFDPATRRVTLAGHLPALTTHGAAAALGGIVYVLGGRSATADTPTARIVAVDPVGRKIRPAGSLAQPLSDEAAVSVPGGILVAGGRTGGATVASIFMLRPSTAAPRRSTAFATQNVYAADARGDLSPVVRGAKPYVYVPNSESNTVDVIDQRTFKVVEHFAVGGLPQHVVPAYDLRTLYVTNDTGNSLTPIDPNTGKPGATIPVDDPYNMYFTPDGRHAIVVAERLHRLDFRNPHTFALQHTLAVPCTGADHMDFSADGTYAIVSCEFSSQLLKVDVLHERVVATLQLRAGAAPQDVKLSPDGKVFYVADMNSNGVWLVDGTTLRVERFMPTGRGAHGLYPSRDARFLYVTNRGEGSITVISFATRRIVTKWQIPGGGSPDMGNVSADGKVLWLSGRYNSVVYAISTTNGRLLARIPVGAGPHGLTVWPQPGRYSLGHTGILR